MRSIYVFCPIDQVDSNGFQRKFCPGHRCRSADDLIAVTNMFVEISGKIVGIAILFPCPSVKKLFNYKKSKFIADVNENFCSGVVSNSDRIDTHIFHNGHLAVYGIIVRGRTFQNLCLYIIQLRFFDGP